MASGKENIPIDIAKRVVDLKLMGIPNLEISKKIEEEFNCYFDPRHRIDAIFSDYILESKLADELANKRILEEGGTLDKDIVHENYRKMKEVASKVEKIIDKIEKYQNSVEEWVARLESDMKELYTNMKDEGITMEQINNIKDSIERSAQLMRGSCIELMKMLDIYSRMQSYARLQDSKTVYNIDKIDLSYKINQGLLVLEKDWFLMVKPNPNFMSILEEAEKKGEVSILTHKEGIKNTTP